MSTRDVTDTNLATYLKVKGFPETARPKLIGNTVTFFFEDSPKLVNEIEAFLNQETTVEPTALFETYRVIRSLVFEIKKSVKRGGSSDGK